MKDQIVESEIEGITKVYQAVGFPTNFHNGEVLSISVDRLGNGANVPILTLLLWTPRSKIPGEFEPGSPEWYRIRIAFCEIDELKFDEFNHQNVIQGIVVYPHSTRLEPPHIREERFKIWISSLFGAELIFTYKRAEVVSVEGTEYHLPRESPAADGTTHTAEIT